jgi:hypothetical protein
MAWYDLTTDSANLTMVQPGIRKGIVRLRIDFSGPIFEEMVLCVYAERNETMGINVDRRIEKNYVF